jgi:hypothetical protein
MQPKAKDTREIEGILQDAIAQAVDFVESEITDDRQKYVIPYALLNRA